MNPFKIKISVNAIFDYVIGNSNYNPIERCIDPTRFEVLDFDIYDNQNEKTLEQNDKFKFFCAKVIELRFIAKEMDLREIQSICNELAEIAPTEINLA